MNSYCAEILLYGEYESPADTRDWRDPEHMSYKVRASQGVSVCIYAETRERAETLAKAWEPPTDAPGLQLDEIYKTKVFSVTLVEEDCDAEEEGYGPEYDEYEVLYKE